MRRGTTPTITANVMANISEMAIHLAFKVGCKTIVKSGDDLTVVLDESGEEPITKVSVTLTQAETLSMKAESKCEVQIRAVEANGNVAIATTIGSIPVKRILEEGVIYG